MPKTRLESSYDTLPAIIKALSCNDHASLTWVGKNYSKAQLIEDLKSIQKIDSQPNDVNKIN